MYTLSKLKPDYFYLRTDISDIDKWKQSKDIPQNRAFYQTFSKEIFNKTSKEREKKTLTVICPTNGTNYIKNPNLPNERSIKLIEKVLRIRKFDLIFLPHLSYEKGINPDIPNTEEDEMDFILTLISRYNIPFVGYLDNDYKFIDLALERGFTKEQIILYIFLNKYIYYSRDMQYTKEEFSKLVNEEIKDYEEILFPNKKKWYHYILEIFENKKEEQKSLTFNKLFKEEYGMDFDYGVTSYDILLPNKDSKYPLRILASIDLELRVKFIVNIIFETFDEFDNIALLTSAEYLFMTERIFAEEMGEGKVYI